MLYEKRRPFFLLLCSTNVYVIGFNFLKILIKILFNHFNFSNQDISLPIKPPYLHVCNEINYVYLEGTVSQIFYSGPSFYFMSKIGKLFFFFFYLNL